MLDRSFSRRPAARPVWLAMAACAVLAGACEEEAAGPGRLAARLAITAQIAYAPGDGGLTVGVTVMYLRGAPGGPTTEVPLADVSVTVEGSGTVNVPLEVQLGPCLDDPERAGGGDTCPLMLSVVLRRATLTLDSVRIGPISATAGGVTQVNTPVVLHEVASLRLSWPGSLPGATGDTLRVGQTLTLTATPQDAGAVVVAGHPAAWSSTALGVATVNAQTGVVTPVGPGTASIVATAGGRTATFDARVYAQAQLVVSGEGQRVGIGGPGVTAFPTVRVTDAAGRSAEAVPVSFTVTAGGGQIGQAIMRTDSLGEAGPGSWTLSASPVVNTLQATVAGLPPATITAYAPVFGQLAVGNFHVCLIESNGITRCWGTRSFGSLGDSLNTPAVAARVTTYGNFAFLSIVSHGQTTCGPIASGATLCWGRVGSNNGTGAIRIIPTALSGGPYAMISAARLTVCGLTAANLAFCWGFNQAGELGDGTTVQRLAPVAVATSLQFTSIEVSWIHTCALTASGAAHCWGRYNGQNALSGSLTPVPIPGGHAFTRLFGGGTHTCGLSSIGEAWCWGDNTTGQLGDGTTTDAATPVLVSGGLFFSMGAAGSRPNSGGRGHTCAITIAGSAYCWGGNTFGALGDGTTTDRLVPTRVVTGEVFVAIGAGDFFTCALTLDRRVFCWGSNANGEFGTGVAGGISSIPVLVP